MSEDAVISPNERTIRLRELLQVEYRFRSELEEIERKTRELPEDMDPLERSKQIVQFWNDAFNFYGNLWIQQAEVQKDEEQTPSKQPTPSQRNRKQVDLPRADQRALSPEQVAARLNMGRSKVYTLLWDENFHQERATYGIKSYKDGGQRMIKPEAVDDYQRRREGSADD